jgi:hypothetical protein
VIKAVLPIGVIAGAIIVLSSAHFAPCDIPGLMILNVENSLPPCPEPSLLPERANKHVTLTLVIPQGMVVHVGDSVEVTLELDATATPVNALDVLIAYPTSVISLVAKDESMTPFGIRLGQTPDTLDETIQVQPTPGISSVTQVARFTFRARSAGTAAVTIASSSEVLANDGFGTDVLGSVENVSITVR